MGLARGWGGARGEGRRYGGEDLLAARGGRCKDYSLSSQLVEDGYIEGEGGARHRLAACCRRWRRPWSCGKSAMFDCSRLIRWRRSLGLIGHS